MVLPARWQDIHGCRDVRDAQRRDRAVIDSSSIRYLDELDDVTAADPTGRVVTRTLMRTFQSLAAPPLASIERSCRVTRRILPKRVACHTS
jgi:hypothetical protein